MSGETNLDELIKSMSAVLVDGLYVFVTVQPDQPLPDIEPRMTFKEAEGTTYILLKSEAEKLGLPYEFPCRMITLNIHSSLEAVGFMARIATELAKYDMGVNPVSGFFHDHLFVPDGRQEDAMNVLKAMSQR
ncbi:ACT domain-containing protein [Aliiroseovarius sp. PrR006]|uniref:ACT domain-containing protein n=1 Tax=Aliiroseovarius sp. PrR006 TaxID=2706883 RepID=UPI0013D3DB44|nr:ACT domain-containing protein [Aliiroseovarius sp. PrR006]NDW53098.1 ACT domain-containing protein [Aliiroseovarius sp. PrR006]